MLVKWLGDGLNCVTPIDPAEKNASKALTLKPVVLFPGWNEVPDDIWEICKLHMQDMVAAGKIEEISEKKKDEKGLETYTGTTLTAVINKSPKRGEEIIMNCFNPVLLQKWKDDGIGASRDDISRAIHRQIEACEKGEDREEK
jgi:hypothetical protein